MSNSMTRQKVWENNIQKQAIMSFLDANGITDMRRSADGFEISTDNGATWQEMTLPQIEKVWWVDDGEQTTIFIRISHQHPTTLTPHNCVVYDVEGGHEITVETITRIDARQFSVVTEPFGINKNIGVRYEI